MASTATTLRPRTDEFDRPAPRTGLVKFLVDTKSVFIREILLLLRGPFSLVFSLAPTTHFLGMFGPLLLGAVGGGSGQAALGGDSVLQWFVPGVIVMICLFGTSMTGSNLLYELMTGSSPPHWIGRRSWSVEP